MKDSYNIFKILMIFIIFIILGYFISFRVTSFSSFTFIIWVVFVIIVIFLYLVFFKLEAGISDKLKNLESLLKHKDSPEETGKSSYSDTNSSLESIEPDIISITAHEIKTPVSIIKGYTDLLLNDSEFSAGINDKAREYIKRIDSSSN
jgi:signal transduction histidine kinase